MARKPSPLTAAQKKVLGDRPKLKRIRFVYEARHTRHRALGLRRSCTAHTTISKASDDAATPRRSERIASNAQTSVSHRVQRR